MTIKSKAFKFLLGIAVVLAVAATAPLAKAADFGTATLRVGSRGAAVMEVQKLVGVTADGAYGPMTEAAVKAWQANVGLYADGIFGPASRAKAYELAGSTGTVVTVPGCPAGAVYNNLTGLPCGTTTTTPVVTTPSTLTGGEADLSIDAESEDDLINNKAGQHAFTIEVEADDRGGDANIERMDLKFTLKTAPREDDIYDIIEAISLEVDGDEVASVDTDSRSVWKKSQTIRLSDFDIVVKSGKTVEIDVLLDIAKLDAADLDIVLELSNVEIRYTDAAGIVDIMEEDFTEKITIEDIDGIEFDADETSSNPASVVVSLNEDRDDVLVLSNDVEVDGQDGTVETVTVLFTMTFAGSKDLDDLDIDDLVDEVYFNGERADDIDKVSDTTFSATFEDVDMDVEAGEEFEVEITVDFKEGDDFIGDTLRVTKVTFEGEGEDGEDFDEDMTPDKAPTVTLTGGALTLADSEIKVNKLNNNEGEVVFTVEFENEGDDDITLAYLASDPITPTTGNEYSAFKFKIGKVAYYAQADGTLDTKDDGSSGTPLAGYTVSIKNSKDVLGDGNDVIKKGKKEEYVITITIDATVVGTSGYHEVELTQVGYVLEAGVTDVVGVLITNLESDDIYLSKNV